MTRESFADLLFFTRAAVLRDPGLAHARLAGEFADWGKLRSNGRPLEGDKDAPPLTFAGLLRAWAEPSVSHDCPHCRTPALFLHGGGCGMLHWHFRAAWHCPFCGRADEIRFDGLTKGRELLGPVSRAVRAIRGEVSSDPPGLPFAEAVARLRALRDADLLDPAHPLEAESLASAAADRPFRNDGPLALLAEAARRRADAVRDARIRAELVTPERLAAARERLPALLAKQEEACKALAAELASLRARPGDPGPKVRLWRGEITHEEYRAIQARKRELVAALRPARLAADRAAALSRELERDLGRTLSADERRVFLEAVEDASHLSPLTSHLSPLTSHL